MPGLTSTNLGAAAIVLLVASLSLPQAFGSASSLLSLAGENPNKELPRLRDSQEATGTFK
jgi:hypothetical protein